MLDGFTVPLTKFCITAESKLSLYMFSICQHEGRWHSGSAWRVTRRKRNSWYKCFTVQVFVLCSYSISHIFKLGLWRLWPSNAECIAIIEKMSWVTWYAPDLLVTWVCRAISKHRPYHANDKSKVFCMYVRWSLCDPQNWRMKIRVFPHHRCLVPGGGSTYHVVPF